MKTNITDFSTEIFEQLADCWKVEVLISSIKLVPCCSADDCGEELKECLITLSRPGAKSISWTKSSWEPTADLVAEITPSRALRLLGEEVSMNGFPAKGFRGSLLLGSRWS